MAKFMKSSRINNLKKKSEQKPSTPPSGSATDW